MALTANDWNFGNFTPNDYFLSVAIKINVIINALRKTISQLI